MDLFARNVPDGMRAVAIEIGCRQIERERGVAVDRDQVRDLLQRPTRRRRPKTETSP
jgi:hypothetical protein